MFFNMLTQEGGSWKIPVSSTERYDLGQFHWVTMLKLFVGCWTNCTTGSEPKTCRDRKHVSMSNGMSVSFFSTSVHSSSSRNAHWNLKHRLWPSNSCLYHSSAGQTWANNFFMPQSVNKYNSAVFPLFWAKREETTVQQMLSLLLSW